MTVVMWKCHKCGKPVYFAERRQSLGFNWHPECLRCEECGKRLNPGQHAEHKGVPYCHVPCYGALFGPQLFGHGSRVESHTSFGKMENKVWCGANRERLEAKLKRYNQFYESTAREVRSREVNGRLVLEGVLRIFWGVSRYIYLREEDDQRAYMVRRRSQRQESEDDSDDDLELNNGNEGICNGESSPETPTAQLNKSLTLPSKLSSANEWDEMDELLQVERKLPEHEKAFVTLPVSLEKSSTEGETNDNEAAKPIVGGHSPTKVTLRRRHACRKTRGSATLKRRCSINGHFYNRETSVFVPPHGCCTTLSVSSLVNTPEVINMLLDKYRVESTASEFSLFVVRDNGEQRKLKDEEYPLLVRVLLGPHEDVAKLFIMEKDVTEVSQTTAMYLNLSHAELHAILEKFYEEEEVQVLQIRQQYKHERLSILQRLAEFDMMTSTSV